MIAVLATWIRISRHSDGFHIGLSLHRHYFEERYVAAELRAVSELI